MLAVRNIVLFFVCIITLILSSILFEYINIKQENNMKQRENKNWNRVEIK